MLNITTNMFTITTSFLYAILSGFIAAIFYLIYFLQDSANDKKDTPILNIVLIFFIASAVVYFVSEDDLLLIPNISSSEKLCKMKTGKPDF